MQKQQYLTLLNYIMKRDSESIEKFLESDEVDFDIFYKFIWDNQLAGNLYSLLINSELRALFPDILIDKFKPSYLKQWIKNERLIREIEFLSELVNKGGIEVIFLKGPFLAERFYGNIDRRSIADIDVLVKNDEIDNIDKLLKRNGFELKSIVFLDKYLSIYFTHHFEYARRDVDLELHWALSTHCSFNLNYSRIWQEKNNFEFRQKNYLVLSDEYELVFQILSIFKDIELGTIKLKSFVDTYMILKAVDKNIKWKEFFDDRKKEGLYVISSNTLDLVLSLLDCHGEFKKLSLYLEQNKMHLKYKTSAAKLGLLDHSRFAIRNKLWAFGLYNTNPFNAFCWWAISLPFRLITYRESSSSQLRRWKI